MLCAVTGWSAAPPEETCQAGKNAAAGVYAGCQQNAQKNLALNGNVDKYHAAVAKCEDAFNKVWQKLENKAARKDAACPDSSFIPGPDFISSLIDRNSSNIALGLTGLGLGSCEASKIDLRPGTAVSCVNGVLDSDVPCTEVNLQPGVPNPNQRAKAATATCSCEGGPLGGVSGACSFATIPGGISCHGICTGSCTITIESAL
jgi:hypothetical protein